MQQQQRLAGKVAIVTGASRGIGRVMALTFARHGARVVIAAKSEAETARLPGTIYSVAREVEALGGEALPLRVDVRVVEELQGMVEQTVAQFGRLDILVNNAGALWWQDVADTPMGRFDLMHEVNVRASFAASAGGDRPDARRGRRAHPRLLAAVDLAALPGKVGYLISKYGMTMLAHGLAEELRADNIAVNALWPVTLIESQATINFAHRRAEAVAQAGDRRRRGARGGHSAGPSSPGGRCSTRTSCASAGSPTSRSTAATPSTSRRGSPRRTCRRSAWPAAELTA
jgi:citronellol/citronellal dehydrogenase